MEKAIATIESISVARGFLAADRMLKAADVNLLTACTTCPGKFLIVVGGQVGAVRNALRVGLEVGAEAVIDSMLIPNVHGDVFAAIANATDVETIKDLGFVETMAAPVAIEAADAAAKAAQVKLIEIRIGRGMGAKAFFSFTGEISDVNSALSSARAIVAARGLMVDAVAISRPHKQLMDSVI